MGIKNTGFFCCHGSLVQANAAHNTGFYYEGENALYVCQYFESDYEGTIGDTKVSVKLRKNRMNGTEHLSSDSSGTSENQSDCGTLSVLSAQTGL